MKTKNKKISKRKLDFYLHQISVNLENIRFAYMWTDNDVDDNTKGYINSLFEDFNKLNEFINNAPNENN